DTTPLSNLSQDCSNQLGFAKTLRYAHIIKQYVSPMPQTEDITKRCVPIKEGHLSRMRKLGIAIVYCRKLLDTIPQIALPNRHLMKGKAHAFRDLLTKSRFGNAIHEFVR